MATVRDYMKMLDYSCFSSLLKLGIDSPTEGFTQLHDILEQVDNERVIAAKQLTTPAETSAQKSRSLHEKKSDDGAYSTPSHASRKYESNARTAVDSGHTVEGSVHAQPQVQPQIVRKKASRFSDRPPVPHAR